MRKTPLLVLSIVFAVLPISASASVFSDDFHRPDSNSTGNGWTDTEVGGGATWGISNNRSVTTGNGNGTPWSYRTDISATSGIAIKGQFSSPTFSDGYYRVGFLTSNAYSESGYNVAFDGQGNRLILSNGGANLVISPFSFSNETIYSYEWDISPSPQNWSYVYVWRSDGAKPSTPNLSWTNGGNNFTPITSGNQTYFTNGLQGTSGTESMYTYLFQVDLYPTTPPPPALPTASPVSISSDNASSTLARFGDKVTLKFTPNKPVRTPVVTIEGRAVKVATTTGNSFAASTVILPLDPEGLVPFSISLTDLAGNASTAITKTTDGSLVFHYYRFSKRLCAIPRLPQLIKIYFCS
jgi:hypothetical protein